MVPSPSAAALPPPPFIPWVPPGTVYGALLNFRREWDLWAPRMAQDPYKAAPRAPVLYIKSANTFAAAGQPLRLEDGITAAQPGATLGLVMGDGGRPEAGVLLCDWSLPDDSYYRPAVRHRCRDGFLGLPARPTPCLRLDDWSTLVIETRVQGRLVQRTDLATLRRGLPQLLQDVGEFMTLRAGDVLMVGTDVAEDTGQGGGPARPLCREGDVVEISAPGFASVVQAVRVVPASTAVPVTQTADGLQPPPVRGDLR